MAKDDVIEVNESTGKAKLVKDARAARIRKREAESQKRLASIEDELYSSASSVIDAAQRFADIDPNDEAPPQEWVDELGEAEAMKRFRVARAAWLPGNTAPMGIKVASMTVNAIVKARASRDVSKEAPRFNVSVVQLPAAPAPDFPRLKVEK